MAKSPEPRSLRLTLRTLLAWLDDTLPPNDVRQIGQQVKETPVARELVDRIQKVTRRRRLTVPPSSGEDATDPNIVAAYLDNELPPEQVAAYEERCLKSDVHLAEVASCHQILSMIGQRAKVPPEVRYRMHRLVRGREAVARDVPRTHEPPRQAAAPTSPAWSTAVPARQPLWQRLGPLAGALVLIALLSWSAVRLAPRPGADRLVQAVGPIDAIVPKAPASVPGPDEELPPAAPGAAEEVVRTEPEPALEPEPEPTEPAKSADADIAAAKAADAAPGADEVLAAPALGELGPAADSGVILRYSERDGGSPWARVQAATKLQPGDRLMALAPFRAPMILGDVTVDLVGTLDGGVTATALRRPEGQEAARFVLEQGQAVVREAKTADPVSVVVDDLTVAVTPPNGGRIGVQRLDGRDPGATEPSRAALRIFIPEGEARIGVGDGTQTAGGPGYVDVSADGQPAPLRSGPVPAWVVADAPSEVEQLHGKDFAEKFPPGGSIFTALANACRDDDPAIRRLAFLAVGAIGRPEDFELILHGLNAAGDPETRKAAIAVLRSYGDRSKANNASRREQLNEFYNDEQMAAIIEKLLIGFTPAERADIKTYNTLVELLDHRDVGARELALEHLLELTGRGDAMGYSPDDPGGSRGLRNWQELLRRGDLPPRALGAGGRGPNPARPGPAARPRVGEPSPKAAPR